MALDLDPAPAAGWGSARLAGMSEAETHESDRLPESQEEWPPREWRETTRAAGHRQALYVSLGMVAIFAVLVVVAIWASHKG
jgi:hypothetical protein